MRCMTEKINSFDFYVPMDIPLVLEGGAMRGVFEAGVLDVFIEKGLRFRKVVGTSAGAMQGMCYMSGQKGRNIRINTTYCNDPRYMGIKHLLREKNYFNFKFMFGELANELDPMDMETYRASDTELYAVVTDGQTGKARYISNKSRSEEDFVKAVEASASIPVLSPPVEIDGIPYVDGGLAIPLVPFYDELPFPVKKICIYIDTADFLQKKADALFLEEDGRSRVGKKISCHCRFHVYYSGTVQCTAGKDFTDGKRGRCFYFPS